MFLEVKERYRDKNTLKFHSPGEVVEYSDERAVEILAVENGRYARKAAEPEPPADETEQGGNSEEKQPVNEVLTLESLEKMSKADLEEKAKVMQLPASGTKEEIIARILDRNAK